MREEVVQKIMAEKIIAIARGMDEKSMLPLAEALGAGGIGLVEFTFDQTKPESFEATARGIRAVNGAFSGRIVCGAGTVISVEQAELAAGAGAAFVVSPNTDTAVIRRTVELGMASLPGAATAGECVAAHNAGADFVKLFPASELGPGYLKALRSPLGHIRFLAVGGIDERNAADFIKAGAVGLGIGGNLVNREWIAAGEFGKITGLAALLVKTVRS
jgi:2-dehydro-3-deoxyphosphogluconate aldolase/(4S)-4-hydroxy-2-oxoglutarate aldolase